MMNELIEPGKYIATVSDYGQAETSTGKPYVYVYFTTQTGEKVKWTGYLTDNAIQRTMDSLVVAGCRDLGGVAEGMKSNAFDTSVSCSITVEHEQDQKDPSKTYARVKWVNPLTKPKDAATIAKGKSLLAQYQGQFEAARMKLGANTSTPKSSAGF